MTQEDPALERVRRHVKNIQDFWYHFVVYVVISTLLVILDRRVDAGETFVGLDWAYWVILFWGLGVAAHAVYTFAGDDYRVDKLYAKQRDRESAR